MKKNHLIFQCKNRIVNTVRSSGPLTKYKIKIVNAVHSSSPLPQVYKLRGIVYHGGFHFNSCVITEAGDIWYHDGIATGDKCVPDSQLKNISDEELMTCREKNIVSCI